MPANATPELLQEHVANGVLLLRVNRPHICNALNLSLKRELAVTFELIGNREDVRCVILTGNEHVFSSGADVNEYENATPSEIVGRDLLNLWLSISRCPIPIIAAVQGYALGGGCELAMHADIIVAGQSTRFGLPEASMGLIPGGGGTQRLARTVGKFVAMHMLMTGETLSGQRAFELGLASVVTHDTDVVNKSIEIAVRIASMPKHCLRFIKELVLESMNSSLDSGIRQEHRAFQTCFGFTDKKERIEKFLGTTECKKTT